MLRRLIIAVGAIAGVLVFAHFLYGETSSTTVQQTTVQTVKPRVVKKAKPVLETTTTVTTVKESEPRQVLTQDTLKKVSDTLCTKGFKPYLGTDKKNVCRSKAAAPDIAYSCVWDSKGPAAFEPNMKGPCSLDFARHSGNIIIDKNTYTSRPPLKYGVEAQCCVRTAK